mmetsp:Transcript_2497/g.3337  ORF Transcript_2497/g.3337 Transcript_2497/m.3337 type:complete len:110 (+) Transcript_2497:92-421(+)
MVELGKLRLLVASCKVYSRHHMIQQWRKYRHQKTIILSADEQPLLCDVFDTAGGGEYRALIDQAIRDANGFLFVYSITEVFSFEVVKSFIEQVERVKDERIQGVLEWEF